MVFVTALLWALNIGLDSDFMITSSNWNIFRVTGHLCGEFPTQKASDTELWCFLWSAPE